MDARSAGATRMDVTVGDIRAAARDLAVAGYPVCVHSSLRSFGRVEGGARAILGGLLAEGCTVLVPTFSYVYEIPPPPAWRWARNGRDYAALPAHAAGENLAYTPASDALNDGMGAVPKAVLGTPGRVRGDHPLNSFAAVGPLAGALIAGQTPLDVYAPFDALAAHGGSVVLMGVGLERMTLLHRAEQRAGRRLFRRCANGPDGTSVACACGSCSAGFGRFAPVLAPLVRERRVGASLWSVYPSAATLAVASAAIRAQPTITHCGDPACRRCNDAVAGGPLLGETASEAA